MGHVFRNALIYGTGNVIAAAVPFLLLPILTRVLSAEQYGVVSMFAALLLMLTTFVTLNGHAGIPVRVFDAGPGASTISRYIGSCLLLLAVSSFCVLALVWLFKTPLASLTSLPEAWVLGAVFAAVANGIAQIRLSMWIGQGRAASYAIFQVTRTVLEFMLALYLVLMLLGGAEGRLWSQVLALAVFSIVAIFSLARNSLIARPDAENLGDAIAFGAPLVPHTIGLFLLSAADRLVINHLLGVEQVGIYTVAVQIGLGFALFLDAANRALVPWLYAQLRAGDPERLRMIVNYTWAGFATLLLLAGAIALLSSWITDIIAGEAFRAAAAPLAWIALGQAFHGMYLLVTNYSFYAKRTGHLALSTLFSGLFGVSLVYLLADTWGIIGASIAFAGAMFVKFIFTWWLSSRAYPMPWFTPFRRNSSPQTP